MSHAGPTQETWGLGPVLEALARAMSGYVATRTISPAQKGINHLRK